MRLKHNKKRNTAFLYEVLTKEVAKAIVVKDLKKKDSILALMKEFFSKGKVLRQELELYKLLGESHSADLYFAERLIQETKKEYDSLDQEKIFEAQSEKPSPKTVKKKRGTSNFIWYGDIRVVSLVKGY